MVNLKKILSWILAAGMVFPLICCAPRSVSAPAQADPVPSETPFSQPAEIIVISPVPAAPSSAPDPAPESSPAVTEPSDLSASSPVPEETEQPAPRQPEEIAKDLLIYYGLYGSEAKPKLDSLEKELQESDPENAWKWPAVLEYWDSVEKRTAEQNNVLPDGLADTDALCIVVLGFQLNANGSMQDELKDRLKVALKCAKKYPRAYVLVTGGGTAKKNKSATEAGKMASWLQKKGISKKRILVEDSSKSTVQNANFSIQLLREKYPMVTDLAIVTSDYHLPTGMLFFESASILAAEQEDAPRLHVVACASCPESGNKRSPMFHAGSLIGMNGDSQTSRQILSNEYDLTPYSLTGDGSIQD